MFAAWAGKISATGAVGSPAGVGSGRFFFLATTVATRASTRTADKKGRRRGLITRNGGWRWLRKRKRAGTKRLHLVTAQFPQIGTPIRRARPKSLPVAEMRRRRNRR